MASNGNLLFSLALICFIGLFIQRSSALFCMPCEQRTCSPPPTDCHHGLTKDICDCCDLCAKGPGEVCGGVWNQNLSCGKGLVCEPDNPKGPENSMPVGKCRPA